MNQPEDSIFVTQQTVDTHGPGVPDGGSTAAMLLAGMLTLGALAYRRKSALAI
jgi:MYXO-CTERM domain-containing protein